MQPPFPQPAPPDLTPQARAKTRPLPSLPWGETLILLTIGLILLQI